MPTSGYYASDNTLSYGSLVPPASQHKMSSQTASHAKLPPGIASLRRGDVLASPRAKGLEGPGRRTLPLIDFTKINKMKVK